jgi:hypothetical protein
LCVRDGSGALFIGGLVFLNETTYKKAGTYSPTRFFSGSRPNGIVTFYNI